MEVFEHVRSEDWMTSVVFGDIQSEVTLFFNSGNLVWSSPNILQFLSKVLLKGSSLIRDEVSHLKCDVLISAHLCLLELFVAGHDEVVVVYHMGEFEVFEVLLDSCGVHQLVVPEGDDLTLTDLGWGCLVGFRGGVVMCILGLSEVVYTVDLFGIDICPEGLCNCLDGALCAAIRLLVKSSRWHKVNIEDFVEFSKEIGDKLQSSIRVDFMRNSMVAVDLTYEYIDDISGCVFLLHRH